ncbi:MAG: hypothetical protein Q7T20_17425 [Saprospiraceae bacterium]|nr:hypothetical protein [Saprospiraceae bacterium]
MNKQSVLCALLMLVSIIMGFNCQSKSNVMVWDGAQYVDKEKR